MFTDQELWNGLQKGDRDKYFLLYRKYYHTLFFIGLKEIKDASLIKDAIHQQFLYLWEKRETVQHADNVRAYLVSSFKRRLNADWKQTIKTDNLEVVWSSELEEPAYTPEELLISKEHNSQLRQQIASFLALLPTRQKELIILKFYEGLTYEEIAEKTNLSQRTVYNSIYEALKKMRLAVADKTQTSVYKRISIFLLSAIALLMFLKP